MTDSPESTHEMTVRPPDLDRSGGTLAGDGTVGGRREKVERGARGSCEVAGSEVSPV